MAEAAVAAEKSREAESARKKALNEAMERAKAETANDLKMGGKRRRVTAKRFCSCVKKVKASKKPKTEGSAIAICTSSLLWPHGKTLHSVSCRRKNHLKTQKRKK